MVKAFRHSSPVWVLIAVLCASTVDPGLCEETDTELLPEAGDLPIGSSGDLLFYLDTAGFRGPEGLTRQEVYVLLDAKQLLFLSQKERPLGEMKLVVAVFDTAGTPVTDWSLNRRVSVDSLDILTPAGAPFRDVVGFDLRPGKYHLSASIQDVGTGQSGRCRSVLEVNDYERKELVFSDLQLATEVARSTEKSRFVKQGWKVTPNTARSFLAGRPISIYFELYNFSVDAGKAKDSFILGYSLVDSTGRKVREYEVMRILKPGESCVKTDILDTVGLSEGTYEVQVEAFDGGNREYVRMRRTVYVAEEESSEPLTEIQRDFLRYYADIRHVADEKTLESYEKLTDWRAKAKFLRAFWMSRDPSPGAPGNERLLEHMLRMSHAENRFVAGPRQRGSDTDKGRVYIKYGPPDDIDYHTSAAGDKPHEVWHYTTRGNYRFIFRDRRGSGNYELVHSTYPGEAYNPYWRDEL